MQDACDRAAITPRISFHGLRHTWASLAIKNDMPLVIAAKNLGHKDTRMVERHYGHLKEDYIKQIVREAAPVYGVSTASTVVPLHANKV
jgi:integrase